MASHAGTEFTLAFGKQSAKGTPAASASFKFPVVSGDFAAGATFIEAAETDASIQSGDDYRVGGTIEGTVELYVRPTSVPFLLEAICGSNANSGAGPYVHTATLAAATPYYTVWRNQGSNTAIDKYSDVRVTALTLRATPGGFYTASITLMGCVALFGTSDAAAALETEAMFVWPELTLWRAAANPGSAQSMELTVARNAVAVPGDGRFTPYDIALGRAMVSGAFTALWETDNDRRNWITGTTSGTAFTSTLVTEAFEIRAIKTASLKVNALLAGILIREFGAPVNTDGSPVVATYGFKSARQAAIADYVKFESTNSEALVV